MEDFIQVRRIASKGGGKGGGGSASQPTPHTPVDYPNTLRSFATARILEVISEGVVYGMHTAGQGGPFWNSIFLDGTPIADAAGNFQFGIKNGDFRYGYPFQDPLYGYSDIESVFSVGVKCDSFTPVVRNLSGPTVNEVRYVLQIPALFTNMSNGDVVAASVTYAFDISVDGGTWTNVVTEQIYGKTTSPYQRAVRITLPPATSSIQIRVENIQPPPASDTPSDLFWSSYTEIFDDLLSYDDTCVISMAVDARDFQSVPQRAFLIDGIMVQIPTNYNGHSHGYNGDWDGSFYTQWTNNPAWILYALLTNTRYGIGDAIDAAIVDKWGFYEAAIFNDQGVPDGKGGTEVRWTINTVLNTQQDAWQVLTAVASAMLATLYFANGTIHLVQDRRLTDPERLFGPADVVSGLFDYTGADYRSRWTAVAVTWNDPMDDYKPAVELVQDAQLVAQFGYRQGSITAFGCTSRGQAIRVGRWLIYTSQFETEVVSFVTGLENADVRPGMLIAIDDPSRSGARLAGRLMEDDGVDTITLDQDVDPLATGQWWIFITIGSAAEGEVPYVVECPVYQILPNNQIVIGNKPAGITPGCMWLARAGQVEPTLWRVHTVTEQQMGQYKVLATEYHIEKWDYIDNGWLIPLPRFSLIPSGPIPSPTNPSKVEYIYRDGGGKVQFGIIISWTAPNDPRIQYYQMEMSGPRGDYHIFRQVVGVSQDVPAMSQGEWTVYIRAFDGIGRRSPPLIYIFTPIGLTARPLPPLHFHASPQSGNLLTLQWTPTGEVDVDYYWIKFTKRTFNEAWSLATTSVARISYKTVQISTPFIAGTYMIKSIDSLGQESVEWAEVEVIPQSNDNHTVLDNHEEPVWAGVKEAFTIIASDNELSLWPPYPDYPPPDPNIWPGPRGTAINTVPTWMGTYYFATDLDLGVPTTVTMTGHVEASGRFQATPVNIDSWPTMAEIDPIAGTPSLQYAMISWVPLASAKPLAASNSPYWDAYVEMQTSSDGLTYTDWVPLKSVVITAQAFRWRMIGLIYDHQTEIRVIEASAIVDIPLRSVHGDNVPLDDTGHLTVTYVAPFHITPTVQLTVREDIPPGGDIVILDSTRDYFTVECRDHLGAVHPGGTIDYFVQGYGGHS